MSNFCPYCGQLVDALSERSATIERLKAELKALQGKFDDLRNSAFLLSEINVRQRRDEEEAKLLRAVVEAVEVERAARQKFQTGRSDESISLFLIEWCDDCQSVVNRGVIASLRDIYLCKRDWIKHECH